MTLQINGQTRDLELPTPATLDQVLQKLNLKPDRIAVERNGTIVAKQSWLTTEVASGDRLEIVHFVGGGCQIESWPKAHAGRHHTAG